MANWTPTGFIGELFRVTGRYVAPPSGIPSPLQWGDETVARERLGHCASTIEMARRHARLELPFSVSETVEFYRLNYGPTLKAFAALGASEQRELRQDLESLFRSHNRAVDGPTIIEAEFLDCTAVRS